MIAFALDAAIVNGAAVVVGVVVSLALSLVRVSHDVHSAAAVIGAVLFGIWIIGYFTTFWTTTGETPGNHAMRIRVVRADGTRLRTRHAFARLAGLVLGLPLFLGYVPILLSERRRGLHDVMAGTVVVPGPH
jgi:uncharacterized RDD family membrane protein YckC